MVEERHRSLESFLLEIFTDDAGIEINLGSLKKFFFNRSSRSFIFSRDLFFPKELEQRLTSLLGPVIKVPPLVHPILFLLD